MKAAKTYFALLAGSFADIADRSVSGPRSEGLGPHGQTADYLEPAIPHQTQQQAALEKLRQLEAKTGRKPNILIILVDDMGYGDPGAFGGGAMLGAPTPNIDSLGRAGAETDLGLRDAGLHALARSFDDGPHSRTQRPHASSACQRSPD